MPQVSLLQGFLTDYFTAIPEEFGAEATSPDAPAFLLVHGFGAFGEQWRSQLRGLAAAGHMVIQLARCGGFDWIKPLLEWSAPCQDQNHNMFKLLADKP